MTHQEVIHGQGTKMLAIFEKILEKLESTNPPDLMDTTQAATFFGVQPQTMTLWRTQSRGPSYVRVCSAIRYRKEDLISYIEKRQVNH